MNRSECVWNCSKYCLTLTRERHRRWCSTQTRSRTGTKCPRQKHPRKLQKRVTFTIHVCPSLSISDLESHCRTYPLTSWPCGWFSPLQFSPFCWLFPLEPKIPGVYSTLVSCPVNTTVSQQQCAGEAALTTAATSSLPYRVIQ